ncbi:hypothetical protein [Pseudomonas turukhanskensis]|uniref:Uncharacterized protein n=1 Tax=Pseudomonas turukhanskensis TaxID=1806536 RepID=A0A9W6NGE4_9PSED|nr:hypothetical protein [Pseudomonas turukhanskensis]GLK89621.1 hypothetical protein GCM10017655_26830 [Pseudomonas turukhanskensis]
MDMRSEIMTAPLSDGQLVLLANAALPMAVRGHAATDWNALAWTGQCQGLHSWRLARIDDEEIDRLATFYRRLACTGAEQARRHQQRIVQLLRARHQQDLALIRALALPGQVIVVAANGSHNDFYQVADEQALGALIWQHRLYAASLAPQQVTGPASSNYQRLLAAQRSQGHDSLLLLFTARPVVLQLDGSGVRLHGASAGYLAAAVDMLPPGTHWQVQADVKKTCRAA